MLTHRSAKRIETMHLAKRNPWRSHRAIDYNLATPPAGARPDDAPETRSRSTDNTRGVVLRAHVRAAHPRHPRFSALPHLAAVLRPARVGPLHRVPGASVASLARAEDARAKTPIRRNRHSARS